MGITWLQDDNEKSNDGLGWYKDWFRVNPNCDTVFECLDCYHGDKGLLLTTGAFKLFLFKNSTDYGIVIEALEHFVKIQDAVDPLIIKPSTKTKVLFGLDDGKPKVYWHRDGDRFYSVRADDRPVKSKGNPLIAALSHPTQESLEASEDSGVAVNSTVAASRRAKNGSQA